MNNFTVNTKHMSAKQIANVGRLLTKAKKLNWFYDHGHDPMIQVGYNAMYGNTYIWSENEQYSLLISDFEPSKIQACYSCPYDGEEIFRIASNNSEMMEKWATRLREKSESKEND